MRHATQDMDIDFIKYAYAKENNIEADLFLGIESGINDLLGRWMITNIAVIEDSYETCRELADNAIKSINIKHSIF